jgi:2-C-methyl-D-erythritol 4-phosphate cytidylyltransferase
VADSWLRALRDNRRTLTDTAHSTPHLHALVPAAGTGSRLGHARPKQYLPLAGRPLLRHTLDALAASPRIHGIHVVLSPDDALFESETGAGLPASVRALRVGGASRAESVRNGLRVLAGEATGSDWVLVHDAARPCITAALLDRLLDAVLPDAVGGLLALRVADTLKAADAGGRIVRTVDRSGLWQAQTPQMFRLGVLRRALESADLAAVTDEASAVEALGLQPLLVEGDVTNLKVTWGRDAALAELILAAAGARP